MSPDSVLIVDDNVDNLELAQILLENEGFAVFLAQDAVQAFQQIQTSHPRLILMDVQLPGMDGLELTKQLRRDASLDNVVILALTAYAMKGDRENALAAGCDGYLTKPIDTRAFSSVVRKCLEAGRASGAAGVLNCPPIADEGEDAARYAR